MSINPEVAALLEARRELIKQRKQLDRDIVQLDSRLEEYLTADLVNPHHV